MKKKCKKRSKRSNSLPQKAPNPPALTPIQPKLPKSSGQIFALCGHAKFALLLFDPAAGYFKPSLCIRHRSIVAISPGHGTHTLAALVPQLPWNIGSVGREPLVKSWQIWLRFFRTGSSQLPLGSCTCWPEAQGVPVPTALHSCMFPVTKKEATSRWGWGDLAEQGGTLVP